MAAVVQARCSNALLCLEQLWALTFENWVGGSHRVGKPHGLQGRQAPHGPRSR